MKSFTSILLGLVATAAGAAITARSEFGAPLPIGEIGWEGSITPGGPVVKLWGVDLEDIERKVQKDHPNFRMYLDEMNEEAETFENPVIEARETLEKRVNGHCNADWGRADVGDLNSGISQLKRINGNKCSTRGRSCIRTQCHGNAAIVLCNDNSYTIDVRCTDIARMAEDIRRDCHRVKFPLVCPPFRPCEIIEHSAAGQAFSPGRSWNVIVGSCGFFGSGARPHGRSSLA